MRIVDIEEDVSKYNLEFCNNVMKMIGENARMEELVTYMKDYIHMLRLIEPELYSFVTNWED